MFALLLAAVLSLNPTIGDVSSHYHEYTGVLDYDAIRLTNNGTATGMFYNVSMKLSGSEAIKLRYANSKIVFSGRTTLGAASDWEQYIADPYHLAYVEIDGIVTLIPDGHTITLKHICPAEGKSAAIVVKGPGKLICDNPNGVTIVRPEDLENIGLVIQVKGKKEVK